MAARTNIPNVIHDLGLPGPPLPTPFAPPPSIPSQNLTQLANASENIVREILLALCQDSAQERKAMGYLRKLQRLESERLRNQDGRDQGNSRDNHSDERSSNKRRAASEIRICSRCEGAFREEENNPQACKYHSGSLEENEDGPEWGEWEPDPDSDEAKETYPEFYHWDCCDARGDDGDSGCTRGSHIALYKKPRPEASRS